MSNKQKKFAHTERTVLDALRVRHSPKERGNGPEWAFIEHVRDSAGFNATRTIDAMALGLWPSRGMELHGYEVKVSRADFRREVADVEKMDAFAHVLDRFWIVAPRGIVPCDELPATWGLLEVSDTGTTIRQRVAAPLLTEARAEIPRPFLVPLLRAAGAAVKSRPEDIKAAYQSGVDEGVKSSTRDGNNWQRRYEDQIETLEDLQAVVNEIDAALGVKLRIGWRREDRQEALARVSAAVKSAVGGGDAEQRAKQAIAHAYQQLSWAQKSIDNAFSAIENETGVKR